MKSILQYISGGFIIVLLAFLLPRIILGTDSYITLHDNLDSTVPLLSFLAKNGLLLSNSGNVEMIMGGIPRELLGGHLNFMLVFFYFFDPFKAYIINDVIVHLIAFIGFFLLLEKHVLRNKKDNLITFGVSLCFAFLPFYSSYGLSVAGMPLLFFALLNLRKNMPSISDYFIILLFPFYSSLVLTGIFIIAVSGLVFAGDIIIERRINKHFFCGLALLTVFYAIVEYNLIYMSFFSKVYISHRTAWNPFNPSFVLPFGKLVVSFIRNLFAGHYHAASLHIPIILVSMILIFLCKDKKKLKYIYLLLSLIILFSFFYSLQYWYSFAALKEKIQILKIFNFGRFHWFHPLLWYLLFALCLSEFKNFKHSKAVIPILIIIQLSFVSISSFGAKQELKYNIMRMFTKKEFTKKRMTFKEFYSEELFREIDNYIGKKQSDYKIGCIGFHPAIAQLNGFFTLDTYLPNYPLEYKKKFRKIISKELDKNPANKIYFDDWGSRCYFFIKDLNKYSVSNIKTSKLKESEIDFDIEAFKELGGEYFFSTVKIINSDKINLKFLKTFEKSELPWRIHVYQEVVR